MEDENESWKIRGEGGKVKDGRWKMQVQDENWKMIDG